MHQVCYLQTAAASLKDSTLSEKHSAHMPRCACVSRNTDASSRAQTPVASNWVNCQIRSRSRNWRTEEGHSRGEQRSVAGRKGKRKWPKMEQKPSQPGRGVLLWIRGRCKGRKRSLDIHTLSSAWRIHGNLPTSASWTALQTERQQMVYMGIVFDTSRQLYF